MKNLLRQTMHFCKPLVPTAVSEKGKKSIFLGRIELIDASGKFHRIWSREISKRNDVVKPCSRRDY